MTAPDIIVERDPDPKIRDAILAPLRAFNDSQVGEMQPQLLAIVLRDPDSDEITGGLWGRSVANWLFVDLLVVPEKLRRRGIGTSLMKKAEEIAVERSCVGIWLYTGSFQAPGFYEKLGYQPFGKLPDWPRGHDVTYYSKRIAA
jgi:GNAT superfamily N-acetyltransferase